MNLLYIFFVCFTFVTSEFIPGQENAADTLASNKDDSSALNEVSYVLGTQKTSWDNAYVLCRQSGMELASVTTAADETAIENFLKTYNVQAGVYEGFYFAGTRYGAIGSDFVWFTSGNPVVYRKFAQGQPDNANGNEYCLHIFLNNGSNNNYEWNDINCEANLGFICQTSKCSR